MPGPTAGGETGPLRARPGTPLPGPRGYAGLSRARGTDQGKANARLRGPTPTPARPPPKPDQAGAPTPGSGRLCEEREREGGGRGNRAPGRATRERRAGRPRPARKGRRRATRYAGLGRFPDSAGAGTAKRGGLGEARAAPAGSGSPYTTTRPARTPLPPPPAFRPTSRVPIDSALFSKHTRLWLSG